MSKNRILSLVLAMVMVLGAFGTVFAETATTEVNPNAEKIQWLQDKGYVLGDAGTNDLRLNDTITRAEVAVIVTKALGLEAEANASMNTVSIFEDVQNHWAKGYINILTGKNILSGDGNGKFRPDDKITNAEVITVMVMAIDGKAPAGVYPNNMIIRANELGLLEGLAIADYSADAIRNDAFVALYNMVMNNNTDQYQVLKGIVLENHRVSKLNKDQVTIEVLEEVKKADYVKESRKEKGAQYTFTIPTELGESAEDLLGRVADFTVDNNKNVVKVKVDASYEIIEGSILAEERSISHDGYNYSVNLPERYRESDETIFRTYINNKATSYEKLVDNKAKETEVEYARVTVKNGKVLYINGFNFVDIAPVKEVKNNDVYVYNDARDGAIKRYTIGNRDTVILVKDGRLTTGKVEDIKVFDVVHEYDLGNNNKGFLVKQDAPITGEYKKINEVVKRDRDDKATRTDYYVVVDAEEILIPTAELKKGVYEYEENKNFYTLIADEAYAQLKNFRGEEVSVVTDLSGKVQHIGSKVDLGEFVGVITKAVGKDLRVVRSDAKTEDYTATLDTKVVVDNKTTGHQEINELEAYDLLYVRAKESNLEKVVRLNTKSDGVAIDALNSREIKLNGDTTNYRITNDTVIYAIDGTYVEVISAKTASDSFAKLANQNTVKARIATDKELAKEGLIDKTGRDDEAAVIVLDGLPLYSELRSEYVEFDGFADRNSTILRVKYDDKSTKEIKIDRSVKEADYKDLKKGDIIKIGLPKEVKKDEAETIRRIEVVIANNSRTYRVTDVDRRGEEITLDNGQVVYDVRGTKHFGGTTVMKGDVISIYLDKNSDGTDSKYLEVVVFRDKENAGQIAADGRVTHISTAGTDKYIIIENNRVATEYTLIGQALEVANAGMVKVGDNISFDVTTKGQMYKIKAIYGSNVTVNSATVDITGMTFGNDLTIDAVQGNAAQYVTVLGNLTINANNFRGTHFDVKGATDVNGIGVQMNSVLRDDVTVNATGVKFTNLEFGRDLILGANASVELVNNVKVGGKIVKDTTATLTAGANADKATEELVNKVNNAEAAEKEEELKKAEAELTKAQEELAKANQELTDAKAEFKKAEDKIVEETSKKDAAETIINDNTSTAEAKEEAAEAKAAAEQAIEEAEKAKEAAESDVKVAEGKLIIAERNEKAAQDKVNELEGK